MPVTKICENCGTEFRVRPRDAAQIFCKKTCVSAHETVHGRPAAQADAVQFSCKECGKPFSYKPSYLTAYRKKFGKDPMYCSMPCSAIGRSKDADARNFFTCNQCGKINPMKRKPGGTIYRDQKFCDRKCKADHQRAIAGKRFKEGNFSRHIKQHGYVWLSVPSIVTGKKHAILEHRYVMSQHLGRDLLPEETVHHVNGDRQHNTIENLELFSSRHGPGQRVVDKIAFAIDMLRTYPKFAKAAGVMLVDV